MLGLSQSLLALSLLALSLLTPRPVGLPWGPVGLPSRFIALRLAGPGAITRRCPAGYAAKITLGRRRRAPTLIVSRRVGRRSIDQWPHPHDRAVIPPVLRNDGSQTTWQTLASIP